jgi:hypothetical protein
LGSLETMHMYQFVSMPAIWNIRQAASAANSSVGRGVPA